MIWRSEAEVWLGVDDQFIAYYDRAGNRIPMVRWTELHGDPSYCRVDFTEVAGVWHVSTVWLGLNHGFFGPPEIFETMVFENAVSHGYVGPSRWTGDGWSYSFRAEAFDGFQQRYSTETEARAGHAAVVAEARALFLPALKVR